MAKPTTNEPDSHWPDRYMTLKTWPGRVVRASDHRWNATRFCEANERSIAVYLADGERQRAVTFCPAHGSRALGYVVLERGGDELTTEEFLAQYAAAHALPLARVLQVDAAGEVWLPWPIMLDVGHWCAWRYALSVWFLRTAHFAKMHGWSFEQLSHVLDAQALSMWERVYDGDPERLERNLIAEWGYDPRRPLDDLDTLDDRDLGSGTSS